MSNPKPSQTQSRRPVRIERKRGAWIVSYTDRKKGGRYMAACFDASIKTEDQVMGWVASNPKLELARVDRFTIQSLDQWLAQSGEVDPPKREDARARILAYLTSLNADDYTSWYGAGWSIVLRRASLTE